MAWSGDITQMKLYDNPDVEFVIPNTGGLLFVDNMVVPKGSQAFADAHALMDYWYNVDNATMQTEWVGYFSPVEGVSERVQADAEAARAAGDEATATQLEEVSRTAIPDRGTAGVDPPVQDPHRGGRDHLEQPLQRSALPLSVWVTDSR